MQIQTAHTPPSDPRTSKAATREAAPDQAQRPESNDTFVRSSAGQAAISGLKGAVPILGITENVFNAFERAERPVVARAYPVLQSLAQTVAFAGACASFGGTIGMTMGVISGSYSTFLAGAVGLAVSSAASASVTYLLSQAEKKDPSSSASSGLSY